VAPELAGLQAAARPVRRGAEPIGNDRLRARGERAERELATTKAALEVVGRADALVELLSESADTDEPSRP